MRYTAGYHLFDHATNENVLDELKADPVEKQLAQHKQKWLHHVSWMENIRYPKQLLHCRPIGRRRRRRRRRRRSYGNVKLFLCFK